MSECLSIKKWMY